MQVARARDSVAAARRALDSTSGATDVQFRIERKTIAAVVG